MAETVEKLNQENKTYFDYVNDYKAENASLQQQLSELQNEAEMLKAENQNLKSEKAQGQGDLDQQLESLKNENAEKMR